VRQAREHAGAERFFLTVQGGAHQSLQALGRGRFQFQLTAALARRGQQPVLSAFQGKRLAGQPVGQGRRVLVRGLAETQRGTDLDAVVADRAAVPVVAPPRRRGHADLGRDGFHRCQRHVLGAARETALGLEQLEQHGKAQARGATLVAKQCAVGRAQCPAVLAVTSRPAGLIATPIGQCVAAAMISPPASMFPPEGPGSRPGAAPGSSL